MIPGRVALVTGSGRRRIGWHVAEALAKQGYALAVHYRTAAAEAAEAAAGFRSLGVDAIAIEADLADDVAVRRMIDQTIQKWGRIDVVVNCAAIWQKQKLELVTPADLRRHFDANALGTFLVTQAAGLKMVAQPQGGCIVLVGDWAIERPYVNYAAYFASKGAIPTLARCFAVELGSRNPAVRVNCVMPGPVLLPDDLPEAERRQAIAGTLLKREGRPENVAQAVLALIDNDFITGACLPVDGGRTIFAPDSV
jgi:pteridine reductase